MFYKVKKWIREHPARSWNILVFILFQLSLYNACTNYNGTFFGFFVTDAVVFCVLTIITLIATFERDEWTPRRRYD